MDAAERVSRAERRSNCRAAAGPAYADVLVEPEIQILALDRPVVVPGPFEADASDPERAEFVASRIEETRPAWRDVASIGDARFDFGEADTGLEIEQRAVGCVASPGGGGAKPVADLGGAERVVV